LRAAFGSCTKLRFSKAGLHAAQRHEQQGGLETFFGRSDDSRRVGCSIRARSERVRRACATRPCRRTTEDDAGLVVRHPLQRDEHDRGPQRRRERVECVDEARVRLAQLGGAARISVRVDGDRSLHARIIEPDRLAAFAVATPLSARLTAMR